MLSLLHIENIAVIEQADISFEAGFNVLSGETGAGKSIIIDAISAIMGMRTYREIIRTGAQKAFVRAVFTGVGKLGLPEYYRIPETDELYIEREIYLDGRNICRINGQTVTVAVLKAAGEKLISIHGQHDSQLLFDETNHLRILDVFAENDGLFGEFSKAFERVQELRAEISRLTMDENEKARRQEMLTYQIKELEKADLQPGEDEELEARQKVLLNAEKLASGIDTADEMLSGSEDTEGVCDLLFRAKRALDSVSRFDDNICGLSDTVQQLIYSSQDISERIRDYRNGFAYSEEELEQIEDRLDVIHKLRRKYGATCADMLEFLQNAREELDTIIFADDHILQLKDKLKQAEKEAYAAARILQKSRAEAGERLSARIVKELQELNMPKVRFLCKQEETELTATGIDSVRFLMSANAGESEKPLSKVASGGELARIMLAIKNVLAERDEIGTMIFDEVDTGVSGRAAQKVAEKLLSVSKGRQVLCVTHLPQIAALAENHLLISKSESGGRTYTSVQPLDIPGRTTELARMIGGAEITETTLRSAREMLRVN